jgi:large subunit ribosomal protein L19e
LKYNIGRSIRKLVKDGLVMRKAVVIHSRSRARRNFEEKRRGMIISIKHIK